MATPTSLNSIDYGMVPNTGTDQTANFQSAINAAQSQEMPLYVPKGVYHITTVSITQPVEIYSSAGAATILGYNQGPIIDVSPSGAAPFGPVHIFGLLINGENQAFPGAIGDPALIKCSQVNYLTIERCILRNSSYHGIYLSECDGRLFQNSVEGSAETGIHSIDAGGDGVIIEGNKVRWSGNNGIQVFRSSIGGDSSIITMNTIGNTSANSGGTGPNGNAITVFRANYVTVSENKIFSSAFSAIRLNSSGGSQVLGNQSWSCQETAIWVEAPGEGDVYQGGVVANNVVDVCGNGIAVTNVNNGGRRVVVSGNQVTNATNNTITYEGGSYQTWGRGIEGDGDALIVGNQIENTDDYGIFLFPTNIGGGLGPIDIITMAEANMLKNCTGGIGFYKDDATYGRLLIGGNVVYNYSSASKYGAIVPVSYNASTGEVTRISGSTDLGNATSSSFTNVKLLLNYSFN